MRKLIVTAILASIFSTAIFLLKMQYNKTPLSLAKKILHKPEPHSKVEVYYLNTVLSEDKSLTKDTKEQANKLVKYLKTSGFKSITLEGHVASKRLEARNKVLSFEIANSLKFYLTNNHKIPIKKLKTKGLGSLMPIKDLSSKSLVVITIRR